MNNKIKRPTGTFIGFIAFTFILYFAMIYLQEGVLSKIHMIPNYVEIEKGIAENKFLYWVLWFLGDMSEANFFKSYLAGIGLIIGSLAAHFLYKKNSKHQGIPIAYGSGLWPWVLTASTVSLVLSNLVYGWNIVQSGWFPTFVVFVSVPAATILVYGGGWKNVFTGAILAVIICVPLSQLFATYVCTPTGIPGVAGNVFGMWAGAVVCFEIYRILPWMNLPDPPEPANPAEVAETPETSLEYKHQYPSKFFIRRIFADFSEPYFAGNEIAGLAIIIGVLVSWLLNPELPVYQSGTLPTLLMAEFITGAVAIYVYWDHWMERAWFPSFPSMVSAAPSIALFYGGSVPVAILAAIFGGLICPAMTNFILMKLPRHWPAVVGTTFSMTVGTIIVGMFVIYAKGIIPGL